MKWILFGLITASVYSCAGHKVKEAPDQKEHAVHEHEAEQMKDNDYAVMVNEGLIKDDTMKGSPKRIAMADIGNAHVHLTYGSPGVKGRIIWGGLVPYDQVWVTGAHQATRLHLNYPVSINGRLIPTGTYALFTIPGREKWEFILNKNYQQHLADDYKATEDVVRISLSPEQTNQSVPRLTYAIDRVSDTSGAIVMAWEKIKIKLPLSVH